MSRFRRWIKHTRYRLDHWFSTGPAGPVLALGLLSLAIVLLAAALLYWTGQAPQGEPGYDLLEAMWISLVRALGGGSMGARGTPWGYRLIMFGITLGSIFVVSLLIGTLTNTISGRIAELRKGRAEVIERGHIVILGWTPQIFPVLAELVAANASQKSACVVILASQDKTSMEDQLRQKLGKTGRTRIVCRTGNPLEPDDLKIANLSHSRAVIVLSPESDNPDADVIKTVLAITKLPEPNEPGQPPERRANPYRIVAAVRNPKNRAVARVAGRGQVVWIDAGYTVARIIAQTSSQSGLSLVYSELLNYRGSEIYFHADRSLEGRAFGETLALYARDSVIGLLPAEGRPALNPPMNTRLHPGDQVILIAQDDHAFSLNGGAPALPAEDAPLSPLPERRPESTLLLGWNWRAAVILEQLDHYVLPGSRAVVAADAPAAQPSVQALSARLGNLSLDFCPADITDRAQLEQLDLASFQHVILLCYSDALPPHQADAAALITLLHLRDFADTHDCRYSITSEMMDDRNRKLAMVTRADDFIVSERLVSLMMAQVAENPRLEGVFEELFNPEGSEVYLKPAGGYAPTGRAVRFYDVVQAARRRGEVAFGYRQAVFAHDKARYYGVVINPDKSTEVSFTDEDRVIVLARE